MKVGGSLSCRFGLVGGSGFIGFGVLEGFCERCLEVFRFWGGVRLMVLIRNYYFCRSDRVLWL